MLSYKGDAYFVFKQKGTTSLKVHFVCVSVVTLTLFIVTVGMGYIFPSIYFQFICVYI